MAGKNNSLSRRQFLLWAGGVLGTAALAACAAPKAQVTESTAAPEAQAAEATAVPEATAAPQATPTAQAAAAPATVVEFWHFRSDPMEGSAEHRMLELFNQSHQDIQIKEVVVSSDAIVNKLQAAIAGGNPPSLTDLWTWVIPSWATADILTQLDSYIDRDINWDDYLPITKVLASFNGHFWGMPWSLNSWLLYYNKDAMKQASLDPDKPPLTTDDLDLYAGKMTKRDSKGIIDTLGFAPWVPSDWIWTWGYVFGGDYYDPNTMKITADHPKIVEAFKWKLSYAQKYGIENISQFATASLAAGGPGSDQAASPTYTGKIAMYYYGQWSLKAQTEYCKMDFDMAPIPAPAGGREKCTLTEGSPYLIPKGAKHPDQAWEFVKWALTDPAAAILLPTETGGSTVTNKKILSGDFISKMEAGPRKNYRKFVDILSSPNVCIAPYLTVTSYYQDRLAAAQDDILWGKKTPEEALKEVTQQVQAELDKSK